MKVNSQRLWSVVLILSVSSFVGALIFSLFHYLTFNEQLLRLLWLD